MTTPNPTGGLPSSLANYLKGQKQLLAKVGGDPSTLSLFAPSAGSQGNISGNFQGGRPTSFDQGVAASLNNHPGTSSTGTIDEAVAQSLNKLDNAKVKLAQEGGQDSGGHKESMLGHVFDWLGRPAHFAAQAAQNYADEAGQGIHELGQGKIGSGLEDLTGMRTQHGSFGKDWQALQGKNKTDFGDVIRHEGGKGWWTGALGAVGDFTLDPLNATGIGEVRNVAKGAELAGEGLRALHGVDEATHAKAIGKDLMDRVAQGGKVPARSEIGHRAKFIQQHIPAAAQPDYLKALEQNMAKENFQKNIAVRFGDRKLNTGITSPVGKFSEKLNLPYLAGVSKLGTAIGDESGLAAKEALKEAQAKAPLRTALAKTFIKPTNVVGDENIAREAVGARSHAEQLNKIFNEKYMYDAFSRVPADQQKAALKMWGELGRDSLGKASTPEMNNLLGKIQGAVDHITSRGQDFQKAGGRVDLLNDYLHHANRFFNAKGLVDTDLLKVPGLHESALRKLAQEPGVGTAAQFLQHHNDAVERALWEHNFMKDLGGKAGLVRPVRNGVRKDSPLIRDLVKNQGYRPINHPSLMDEKNAATHVFHPEIADSLERGINLLRESHGRTMAPAHWVTANKALKALDSATNSYKKYDIAYNPGSHGRIILSNLVQQMINGFSTPSSYSQALKVLTKHDGVSVGKNAVPDEVLRSMNPVMAAQMRHAAGTDTGVVLSKQFKNSPATINDHMLHAAMMRNGVFHNFIRSDIRGDAESVARNKLGKIAHGIEGIGEGRDNFFRAATFIDALKKQPSNLTFEEAAKNAAAQVRKTHLDFANMTAKERSILARAMPFYGVISRSTPMALRALVQNPGRVANIPLALQEVSGTFPGQGIPNELIPGYMQQNGAVPVGDYKGMPVMLDQKNDVTDALQNTLGVLQGGNPITNAQTLGRREILSNLNPIPRIPEELISNVSAFTGQPIVKPQDAGGTGSSAKDILAYLATQYPLTNLVRNLVKQDNAPNTATQNNWNGINPSILSYLTGAGFKPITTKDQQSQVYADSKRIKNETDTLKRKNGQVFTTP